MTDLDQSGIDKTAFRLLKGPSIGEVDLPASQSPIPTTAAGLNQQVQINSGGILGGITNTQLTARIAAFTSSLPGAAPASGGGTNNFLRADGTWQQPIASANVVSVASFGSFATDTPHPITQADINANPQWAHIYDTGTDWDTVAVQEAIIAAFTNALPAPSNAIYVEATTDIMPNGFFGQPGLIVNSTIGGGIQFVTNNNPVAGAYIMFAFKEGPVVVTETTIYHTTTQTCGTWQWQGSNDNINWTNIGATFTLGGANTQVVTTLSANVTAYNRYRMLAISGNSPASTNVIREVQFKQGGAYVTGNRYRNYSWLSVTNKRLFFPPGQYYINRPLIMVAQNFEVEASSRGSYLQWHGSNPNVAILTTDSASYGSFRNLSFNLQEDAKIVWDMNGTGNYGGLKTQQLTVYDCLIHGGGAEHGIYISRAGGSAQGDTITFVNPYLDGCTVAAVALGSQNALSVQLLGGDIQGCRASGIRCYAGFVEVIGTSFQGQAAPLYTTPPDNQIVNDGADIVFNSGQGPTNIAKVQDVRSESDVFMINEAGYVTIDNSAIAQAGMNDWFNNYPYLIGHLVRPSIANNNARRRTFMVVDDGGPTPAWRSMSPQPTSTPTVLVDPGAGLVVNAWATVDYVLHFRYTNSFTEHRDITANTATTITINPALSDPNAPNVPEQTYHIGGETGSVAPNFDAATGGFYFHTGATSHGINTTAGSTTINTLQPVAVGNYIIAPNARNVGGIKTALIAKITASLGSNNWTINIAADYTLAFASFYWGAPLVDNKISYIEIPFFVVSHAQRISMFYTPGGLINQPGSISRLLTDVTDTSWLDKSTAFGVPIGNDTNWSDFIANKQYRIISGAVIPTGATIDLTATLAYADIFTYTPNSNATLNAPVPGTLMSRRISIHLLTSGVTPFTITFGTNFKSTGTLSTGAVDAKKFVIVFESDGTTWNEVSRTAAM